MVKFNRRNVSLSDLWLTSHERVSDFTASSWQREDSPVPLLVVRAVLAGLATGMMLWSLLHGTTSAYWLIYLTNWGILLLVCMTLSGLLISVMAVANKIPVSGDGLPWYVSVYWGLFNLTLPIALTITLLFWILLYDPSLYTGESPLSLSDFWLDIATHGFNSCIAVAELVVARTPVRLLHMYQSLGLGVWYIVFSVIYYAAGGTDGLGNPYIYPVLDWRSAGSTTALVFTALAGLSALYLIMWGTALGRDKLSTSFFRTVSHDLPAAPPDPYTVNNV